MSTRSAKRRRISGPEFPNLPSPERASRTVKAALVETQFSKSSTNSTRTPSRAIVSSIAESKSTNESRITRYGGKRQFRRDSANDEIPTQLDQESTVTGGKANGEAPRKSHTPDRANGVLVDTSREDANKDISWVDGTRPQRKPPRRSKRGREQSGSGSQDELQTKPQLEKKRLSAIQTPSTRAKLIRGSKRNDKSTKRNEDTAERANGVEENQIEPVQADVTISEEVNGGEESDSEISYPTPSKRSSGTLQKQSRQHSINIEQSTKSVQTPTSGSGRKRGRPRNNAGGVLLRKKSSKPTNIGNSSPNESLNSGSGNEFNIVNVEAEMFGGPTRPLETFSTSKEQHKQSSASSESTPSSPAEVSNTVVQGLQNQDEEYTFKEATLALRRIIKKNTSDVLTTLKTRILEGLTGKRRLPLVNLETEYQKVHQLVEQTVLAGEGNSMLVIGSRGAAKTTLVETVIADLALGHGEEFHVVRLNGFIHTDDKLALREIWRQLGREMEVEDDSMGIRSNYADTLMSLLALLSHPVDVADGNQVQTAKSVIFVIDEFDLFASHPRQTLLYNLFDVAQSRNAPIAVLGITTKIDVVESLEKRVKSRFGQRYVYLSLPRTLPAFQAICQSALVPQHSQTPISARFTSTDKAYQKLLSAWSAYISALFSEDPILQAHLLRTYTLSKSIPAFLTSCLLPIAALPLLPTGASFHSLSAPDSKLALLSGLSDLALALLIAAARLDIVLDTDVCNFNLCYDEYVAIASRSKAQSSAAGQLATSLRIWNREVARGAWETLVMLELVLPVGGGRGEGMWRVEVALEEIAAVGVGRGMEKWCKEI